MDDAAESTYEAVCYKLRTYGVRALENPNCQRRLGDLSAQQLERVIAALIRMRARSYRLLKEARERGIIPWSWIVVSPNSPRAVPVKRNTCRKVAHVQ